MARELTIGLKGLDNRNLGSQLMALAVRRAFPEAVLAIPLRTPGTNLRSLLSPSGVWSWSDVGGHTRLHQANVAMARRAGHRVAHLAGSRRIRQVDAVLDLSGYAYGSPLKVGPVLRMADWTAQWADQGIPTVLLPQSFGSFDDDASRQAMGAVIDRAAAVFARDRDSLDNLLAVRPDALIEQIPDIAIPVAGERVVRAAAPRRSGLSYGLILPNRQVTRKTGVDPEAYIQAMRSLADVMAEAGLDVCVAAHEGTSDDELVDAVARGRLSVRTVDAAQVDKMLALIRGAEVVVSSRYHGAVAALANNIPALAIGWAEKYHTLMDEFSVPELAVGVTDEDFGEKATALLAGVLGDMDGVRRRLGDRAAFRADRIDGAWKQVRQIVDA